MSSRRVAGISSFHNLSQSFWASRFEEDHEMGFALVYWTSAELKQIFDWRRLYIAYKDILKSPSEGLGVKNRRRIWYSLDHILEPLKDLLCYEPGYEASVPRVAQHNCTAVISRVSVREDRTSDELRIGSRVLTVNQLRWPQFQSRGQIRIGISLTCFDGRTYVSGIRTWQREDHDERNILQQLGLIIPATESVVSFDPNFLYGLEIALTTSGIVALRFLVRESSGDISYTAGDFTTREVGVARIIKRSDSNISALQLGFDVCTLPFQSV
jgi:hypothetical protein